MKKHFILFIFFFFVSVAAMSQLLIKNYSCEAVETEARFGDSLVTWNRYLEQNINTHIPEIYCAPPGTYKVEIRFLIDKDGTVRATTPMTKNGYGMEGEVKRVIDHSPKWRPATRNGRTVRAYRRQSFIFTIPEFTTIVTGMDKNSFPNLSTLNRVMQKSKAVWKDSL